MNFAFSEEQEQLRQQIRRFLAERCPLTSVRDILDGRDVLDRSLYRELGRMGLLGAAIPEEFGGSGTGPLELCVIAEEAGRALAPIPLLSSIYLAAEIFMTGGTDDQKSTWLPRLASGESIATFAHAERAGRVTDDSIRATVSDGKLTGTKLAPDGGVADVTIVSAREGDKVALWLVGLDGPGVTREPLSNLDPTRPQVRLRFDGASAERLPNSGWASIEHALDRAAVLLAFEQIGGADRALETAREYALDRMAFGRQIGSFQAIKHLLVDMYVAATLARSNSYYGAWALSTASPELPIAAATSRISATEAFLLCARNNIQVHGGIGYAWESDCHLYYRRANALALAVGPTSMWEGRLIQHLCQRDAASLEAA